VGGEEGAAVEDLVCGAVGAEEGGGAGGGGEVVLGCWGVGLLVVAGFDGLLRGLGVCGRCCCRGCRGGGVVVLFQGLLRAAGVFCCSGCYAACSLG
jgi:hypothetical protein